MAENQPERCSKRENKSRLLEPARYLLKNISEFVFPPLCVVCDMPRGEQSQWLCDECLTKLHTNAESRNACPRCAQNKDHHACACHLVWDHPFSRIHSLFDFDDTVRGIAHNIKYQGRKQLAYHVGNRFAGHVPRDLLQGIDIAVPIPLHFFRTYTRGYNQADYFARGILSQGPPGLTYIKNAIKRTRHTKTQTKLDKSQRQKNLKGVFAVSHQHEKTLKGKVVLLVDDVVTTGATTGECSRTLLEAGVGEVRVLSLARD